MTAADAAALAELDDTQDPVVACVLLAVAGAADAAAAAAAFAGFTFQGPWQGLDASERAADLAARLDRVRAAGASEGA